MSVKNALSVLCESDPGSIHLQSIKSPSTTNDKSIEEMFGVDLATAESWRCENNVIIQDSVINPTLQYIVNDTFTDSKEITSSVLYLKFSQIR